MPVLAEPLETLEILVVATEWEDVIQKMSNIGIDEKTKITRRDISGLFMVEVSFELKDLTDEFYDRIKEHSDLSIISDTASWQRSEEVLREIYKVETELRKLLLHIYDLVEVFYEMFSKTLIAKNFAKHKQITEPNHIDPLTSRLMLGEMIEILQFDLSWVKRSLSSEDLLILLEDSKDIDGLKSALLQKLKYKRVWDVIAENVLKQAIKWEVVQDDLAILKEFRNKASHFQIITPKEKAILVKSALTLRKRLEKQKTLNKPQLTSLNILLQNYTDTIVNSPWKAALDAQKANQAYFDQIKSALTGPANSFAAVAAAASDASNAQLKLVSNILKDIHPPTALGNLNSPSSEMKDK